MTVSTFNVKLQRKQYVVKFSKAPFYQIKLKSNQGNQLAESGTWTTSIDIFSNVDVQ